MTTTYVGGISIGAAVPGVLDALVAAIGDIQGRITALASFVPSLVPPSLTADIGVATSIIANLTASIAVGITPPSIDLQVAIMAGVMAALQIQLQVILDLFNLFDFGIHVWHYNGRADTLGADMTTELAAGMPGGAGPAENIDALVLATNVAQSWAAMQAIFKTTP